MSDNISIFMDEDLYLSTSSNNWTTIINMNHEFVIKVASVNTLNYLFYFCVDTQDKLMPSYRWTEDIWRLFYRYKHQIDIRNLTIIDNYCNNCYTFKNHDYCKFCTSINYLK